MRTALDKFKTAASVPVLATALMFNPALSQDADAAMVTLDFGPSLGAPTTGDVTLTNQLSSYGVTFSTTDPAGVTWIGGDYIFADARNSIISGDTGASEKGAIPIRIDFSDIVDFVSIRGFDGGGDIDTFLMNAYSSSDTLVDSFTMTDEFASPGFIGSVSGASISYITVEVSNQTAGLFLDDLTFNTAAAVPVPAAVWFMGSALFGLGVARTFRQDVPQKPVLNEPV